MTDWIRPFLKYPGNKYRILDTLIPLLGEGRTLIEPFVGSGAVFLNARFERFILNDANPHLINLYRHLQADPDRYIREARTLFGSQTNTAREYYRLRDEFNRTRSARRRAVVLLYLLRHGFNGLIRFGPNGFNVPFGKIAKPYFPEKELRIFAQRSQQAVFYCEDFRSVMRYARNRTVVYCDPPYADAAPSKKTFTTYDGQCFTISDQVDLSTEAQRLRGRGVRVVISNHDTPDIRRLYREARKHPITVSRTISCLARTRKPARELLAVF